MYLDPMKFKKRKFHNRGPSDGAALIVNLALISLILAFGALLIDLPRSLRVKRLLQLECDAAAVAGATQLLSGTSDEIKKLGWLRAKTVALKYLEDNPIYSNRVLENPTTNSNGNLVITKKPTSNIPNKICKPDNTVSISGSSFHCSAELIYKFTSNNDIYNVSVIRGIQYRIDPSSPGFNPNKDKGLRFAPIDIDDATDNVTIDTSNGSLVCTYGSNIYCPEGDTKMVWEVADSVQITVTTRMKLTLATLLPGVSLYRDITAVSIAKANVS